MLDISRIVAGEIRLNVQSVAFPETVRNASGAVTPDADAKGRPARGDAGPTSGARLRRPERLQQSLWNLLSNAVKFTRGGGKVQVSLQRVDSHVEVSVTDTGIGIAPEFLPHVFEGTSMQIRRAFFSRISGCRMSTGSS